VRGFRGFNHHLEPATDIENGKYLVTRHYQMSRLLLTTGVWGHLFIYFTRSSSICLNTLSKSDRCCPLAQTTQGGCAACAQCLWLTNEHGEAAHHDWFLELIIAPAIFQRFKLVATKKENTGVCRDIWHDPCLGTYPGIVSTELGHYGNHLGIHPNLKMSCCLRQSAPIAAGLSKPPPHLSRIPCCLRFNASDADLLGWPFHALAKRFHQASLSPNCSLDSTANNPEPVESQETKKGSLSRARSPR
jgi:hypothetical protein